MFLTDNQSEKNTQTDITSKYIELLETIANAANAGRAGPSYSQKSSHAQRRDRRIDDLKKETNDNLKLVKNEGTVQLRLKFNRRPNSTPKNPMTWRYYAK